MARQGSQLPEQPFHGENPKKHQKQDPFPLSAQPGLTQVRLLPSGLPHEAREADSGPLAAPTGWKAGDTLTLTPTMSLSWNDVQETGRCYVELAIFVTCEGREGFLTGMIPINPNMHDFSKDAE